MPPVDIFITYKDREDLFERSLSSFVDNTDRSLYRLTIVCDGHGAPEWLFSMQEVDHILTHRENLGLGPSINQALAHIDALNKYEGGPLGPYLEQNWVSTGNGTGSSFICYNQDDLLYSPKWLETLMSMFLVFEGPKNIGFASGVECIEHAVREKIADGVVTKDWIRAAQMFARYEYWMSMFPIPSYDPETGRRRAKPNDGMGSGVDWWFIRNHENSVCKTGRTNLVLPGLVKHLGYAESTWLKRELPESDLDKAAIRMDHLRTLTMLTEEFDGYAEEAATWNDD